jgi:hypothetical protein
LLPSLLYGTSDTAVSLRYNVPVSPGDTTIVSNPLWKYSRQIMLNTTVTGANVAGDEIRFPVLIRLTGANFDFSQAKPDGADIRFTNAETAPLPYEVERWDAASQRAEIWVRVDTVYGNRVTPAITMYWGNADAGDLTTSGAVFDTAEGFQGVWHLAGGAPGHIRDATVNGYHGISPDTAAPQVSEGLIGNCREFDGVTDYLTMPGTADSKLNFPENGNYTVSAWVFLDTLDTKEHAIVAKGGAQYFLMITDVASNAPVWDFAEFSSTGSWQTCTSSVANRQWTLLTGVVEEGRHLLYCNGTLVDSTPNSYQTDKYSRNTSNDLTIGRFLKLVYSTTNSGSYCFFKGSIDEVRISGAALNSDWARLCYMNQRADDRLVEFK